MTRQSIISFGLCIFIAVSGNSIALGDLILEFGQAGSVTSDGSVLNSSYTPGSTLEVEVYLTQRGAESRLSNPSTGVAIADWMVGVDVAGLTPKSFSFGSGMIDDMFGNSGISGQTVRLASVEPNGIGTSGPTVSTDGVNDNSVLLGTIVYDVDAGATGAITLTAAPSGGLASFALADPVFPAGVTVQSNTAVFSAVPEPTGAFPLLLVTIAGMQIRRRRH